MAKSIKPEQGNTLIAAHCDGNKVVLHRVYTSQEIMVMGKRTVFIWQQSVPMGYRKRPAVGVARTQLEII